MITALIAAEVVLLGVYVYWDALFHWLLRLLVGGSVGLVVCLGANLFLQGRPRRWPLVAALASAGIALLLAHERVPTEARLKRHQRRTGYEWSSSQRRP